MKSLVTLLLALFIGQTLFAAGMSTDPAPYGPVLKRLIELQDVPGPHVKRLTTAVWDFAVNGGKSTTLPLGVYLPSHAIITRSYFYVVTPLTQVVPATGTGTTMAFQCEDANNIKTATDLHSLSANSINEGASTGTAANMVASIANKCQVSAVITTSASAAEGWVTSNNSNAVSAGKIRLFIEWVAGDT